MEQKNVVSAQDVANRAENIYRPIRGSAYTYVDVLDGTLTLAGFPPGTYEHDNVMHCFPVDSQGKHQRVPAGELSWTCEDLVSMWLVKNHLVGLSVAIRDNLYYEWSKRLEYGQDFCSVF